VSIFFRVFAPPPDAVMRALRLLTLGLALGAAAADPVPVPVPALTDADFEASIRAGRWLVMFHAPWCGHCQKLKPLFTGPLAASGTLALGPGLRLATVDCTTDKVACDRGGVHGYPTFMYFVEGQGNEYEGPRDVVGWEAFARRLLDPVPTDLPDADALRNFVDPDSRMVNFVWHVPESADSSVAAIIAAVELRGVGLDGVRFGRARTLDGTPYAAEDKEQPGRLLMYNDVRFAAYPGPWPWAADSLGDWVQDNRYLVVPEVTGAYLHAAGQRRQRLGLLLCAADMVQDYDYGRRALRAAALHPSAAPFRFGRLGGEAWDAFATRLGVDPAQYPHFLVYDPGLDLYYRNDTHAALIREALGAPDDGTDAAAALMASFLGRVRTGTEPVRALGLKGHLNRVTQAYFPSMLYHLEEMQILLLLVPVLLLVLVGVVIFLVFPEPRDPVIAYQKRQ